METGVEKLSKSKITFPKKNRKKGQTSCRVLREDAARREAEEATALKLEIWKTLLSSTTEFFSVDF